MQKMLPQFLGGLFIALLLQHFDLRDGLYRGWPRKLIQLRAQHI